ncbi:uncharacterized protein LOC8270353 isoform X1 [Ricinus communis]|uniref:uncharacterized protein LOC8270353 isoform X1 n=1 Tax=Ricinus communis TaxID=3988 RepID=UPI0007729E9D|nr:uncharacterized protein LOC8270353 isoform X1 [Ricinus communis]|eukprot:XP_015575249.1 uncharacterized protein LOC8270353 [Ricinus communis]
MESWNSQQVLDLLIIFVAMALLSASSSICASDQMTNGGVGRRVLLGFKEKPRGSNLTFDCSPSGACVPCLYSEKSDEKYRCSETGYRIPLKCVEIKDNAKDGNEKKSHNSRSAVEISQEIAKPQVTLHDTVSNKDRSLLDDGSQAYITYRSCIPPVSEEKVSVFGFEGIVFCLFLISGSVVYFRRKQTATMSGVGGGRIQMSSRF